MIHCVSLILLLPPAMTPQDRGDPLASIRAMADRGEFGDAWEAVRGLPEPARSREETYLRYQSRHLEGVVEAGRSASGQDANDSEILRLVALAEAMLGRLDAARGSSAASRRALERDSRLSHDMRLEDARKLDALDLWIEETAAYRARVAAAERRSRWLAWATVAVGAIACLLSFGLSLTSAAREGKGAQE